jgi:hypothetical protein
VKKRFGAFNFFVELRADYCGAATSLGKVEVEALLVIVGAPMPAVVDPNPS